MDRRFLHALRCKNSGRAPVWLMRQAGRYLPEYQAMRKKHSFWQMCKEPDLVTQATLFPIQRFGLDAAILFSDILLIPEVLGCGVEFLEGRGPVLQKPLRQAGDVAALARPDVSDTLSFVYQAICQLKQELDVPLIGFCGGAFTLASYMIEGAPSRELSKTKQWAYRDPESFHRLLQHITDLSIDHLQNQVAAGVDALQIFDSWAHVLAYPQFHSFSLRYLQQIVEAMRDLDTPVILFCRGSSVFFPELGKVQPAGISLDWNASLVHVRREIGPSIALQGNLDPYLLLAGPQVVKEQTRLLLAEMGQDPGYIVNLGHGVLPGTPLSSVEALIDCVKGNRHD